eukprot:sb/3474635/
MMCVKWGNKVTPPLPAREGYFLTKCELCSYPPLHGKRVEQVNFKQHLVFRAFLMALLDPRGDARQIVYYFVSCCYCGIKTLLGSFAMLHCLSVRHCLSVCLFAYARPSGSRKLTPGLWPGVRADRQGICQRFLGS